MTAPAQVGPSPSGGGPVPSLTARELETLTRVATGATYIDLAAEWFISELAVRGYGSRAMRKLGANSIAHAVFLACHAGLLDGRPRRHGDHAGFAAHQYRGEEPCEACRAGERAYRRGREAARKTTKAHAA
ncbi:response regulator transcription factor [Streptomyces sp. NPDC088348]|uniref:response regulator transcription factor n=1 Tax=Streptomyces sp. NPDC088348 TaxID=3365853 RepID=UPI0038219289